MQEQTFTIIFAVVGASVVVLLTTIVIMCYKWFGQLDSPHHKESQSLNTEDVQTSLAAPSNQVESAIAFSFPVEFHKFMQGVIRIFHAQRKQATNEFAVLFLSPDRDLKDVSSNMRFPTEATDCDSYTFPADDELYDYITAGPHGSADAISILLGKLDTLIEKFGSEKCQTIVLYTWQLPNDGYMDLSPRNCKVEIIEMLGHLSDSKQIILVYTDKLSCEELGENIGVTDEEEARIVREIEAAGILVLKEQYQHHLPPLINHEHIQ